MTASVCHHVIVCAVVLLVLAGSDAACTPAEQQLLLGCVIPHNAELLVVLTHFKQAQCHVSNMADDHCTLLAGVTRCINSKEVSDTTCRGHYEINKLTQMLDFPCSLDDVFAACPNNPRLKGLTGEKNTDGYYNKGNAIKKTTTTTKPHNSGNSNEIVDNGHSGSQRPYLTQWLLMMSPLIASLVTSLMTTPLSKTSPLSAGLGSG